MKFAIAILLMLCSLLNVAQNNYRILKVEGCIKVMPSLNCISKQTILSGQEMLKFDSICCFAILMSSAGEIFSLKVPDTISNFNKRELLFTFAETTETLNSSQIRGSSSPQITNFEYFFGNSKFTVIGDEVRIGVNPLLFPINKKKFLVLHYNLDTFEVSKRLGFRDQVFRIQKNSLNEFQGMVFNKEKIESVCLYYYEPATKSSQLLATFDLAFISLQRLNDEFEYVYNQLPNKGTINAEELEHTFETFFENAYGKTETQSLHYVIDEYISKLIKN